MNFYCRSNGITVRWTGEHRDFGEFMWSRLFSNKRATEWTVEHVIDLLLFFSNFVCSSTLKKTSFVLWRKIDYRTTCTICEWNAIINKRKNEQMTFQSEIFNVRESVVLSRLPKSKKSTLFFQLEFINWFPIMWNEDRWAHDRVRWSMTVCNVGDILICHLSFSVDLEISQFATLIENHTPNITTKKQQHANSMRPNDRQSNETLNAYKCKSIES